MTARSFSPLVCIRLNYSYDPPPVQALCSSNLPKLLERDTPLFIAILGDLFPRKALPLPSHDILHRGVAAAAKEMGLQPLEEQMTKVDQLHETMEVLSGLRIKNQGCHVFQTFVSFMRHRFSEAVHKHQRVRKLLAALLLCQPLDCTTRQGCGRSVPSGLQRLQTK